MSLKRKILIGYSLILGLVIIVCLWAIFNLYWLGNASEAILQENYRSILAAENMVNALERQDSSLLLFALGFEDEAREQFRQNEVEFLQWLGRAKDNITLEDEAETLAALEATYLVYLNQAHHLFETPGTAATIYQETVLPQFQQVRQTCVALREMNQQAMLLASGEAESVARRAIWSMSGFSLVMASLGLALSLFLAGILTHPLKEMTLAAGQIAEGNYEVVLNPSSNDELGRLAQEIMVMSGKLKAFHELNVSRLLTEKRRSEAIIRSMSDGLLLVDNELKVVAINPMAAQMLNTTPEQAVDHHVFEIMPKQELYHHLKAAVESGRAPELDEAAATLTLQRGDQVEYYHAAITPVKTEQNRLLGVVLLLQDITKLKTLDRLKSEFVTTASHELRTPLTSIAMSIGLLMESAPQNFSKDEQALLCAAQEEVQRLRALVNDLLDLSKIESGRMEMEIERIDPILLITQAISTLAAQAKEKKIELAHQISEGLPEVKADPNKITWVLTNLLANALRYTEPGGHVRVSAQPGKDIVCIAVSDDGAGIPLEYQGRIFDKFVQVKNDKAVGGSGLGLAISKEIVKAHGGTIWVDSAPGQGSTFTFTLPAAPAFKQIKGENNHV